MNTVNIQKTVLETEEGNIWTSSEVSSGIDLTFTFIKHIHEDEVAQDISVWMEYSRQLNSNDDSIGITIPEERK